GANTLTLYVNGAQAAQQAGINYYVNSSKPLRIGAGRTEGTPMFHFPGQIAEVSFWNRALTEAEIGEIKRYRLAGDESGLVGYWPLDHIDTGSVPDAGGNSLDGTIEGTLSTVDAGTLPLLEPGSALLLASDGALRHHYPTAGGVAGPGDTEAGSVTWNRWTHVAVTNDGTTARTLIDGEVRSEGPVASLAAASGGLRIGQGLDGAMAEVRLWNVARTADQIVAGKDLRPAAGAAGLVADWPLDEASGTQITNRVSGAVAGTLVGGERVAFLADPFPGTGALELDGTAAYLAIPHAPEIHFAKAAESFTVEVWVKPASAPATTTEDEHVVVEKWSGIGSFPYALRYRHAGGEFVFARSTGALDSTIRLESAEGFGDGEYHHLAAVKDGAALRLYVDGALEVETADLITTTVRGESPLYLGARAGASHFFTGAITELRLWRRALTAAEIAAGRWSRLAGNEPDLAGYWPLDTLADGEVSDGRIPPAGAITGGQWLDSVELPLLADEDPPATTPAAGFDGLTSAVTVPAHPALMPAAAITVEAWVKPATGGQAFAGPVVSCGDAISGWGLRATTHECGFLLTLGAVQHRVTWSSTAGAGRWLHLAGVYDGTTLQLYVNGVPVAEARETVAGTITPYGGALVIGAHPYWRWRRFEGEIAEVRVWSTALVAAQIQTRLFRRLNGDEPNLVGYWPLSASEGTVATNGGGTAGDGVAEDVRWTAADLPPRLATAVTPAPESQDRLALLEHHLATLDQELAAAETLNQLYELQKNELQRQVDEQQQTFDQRCAEYRVPFDEEIAAHDQEIADVTARRVELAASGFDAFVADLAPDARKKIDAARATLAERGGYGLAKVDLDLRFVASADGTGAYFPEPATESDPAMVAEVDLALGVSLPAAAKAPRPRDVPSVVGLTRALAERRLVAAGFAARFHAQAVVPIAGQPSRVGRVVNQLPDAGSAAAPGTTVRLFLGKAG
ncbi:MAG: PASTA domain-containing protein, partial [bacterium]|nr:PASTA domain-containing protein [bacterium]